MCSTLFNCWKVLEFASFLDQALASDQALTTSGTIINYAMSCFYIPLPLEIKRRYVNALAPPTILTGTFLYTYNRTTILPQNDALVSMLDRLKEFHLEFMKQYS